MPGVISAAAKHYVEFDEIVRAGKRRRTSPPSIAGDVSEQNEEAIVFEVSCEVYTHTLIGF